MAGNGIGSGFVVSPGTVVTNFHVVEGGKKITLTSNTGQKITASGFTVANPKHDIAIVKYSSSAFPPVPIELAENVPRKGTDVAALAHHKDLASLV